MNPGVDYGRLGTGAEDYCNFVVMNTEVDDFRLEGICSGPEDYCSRLVMLPQASPVGQPSLKLSGSYTWAKGALVLKLT